MRCYRRFYFWFTSMTVTRFFFYHTYHTHAYARLTHAHVQSGASISKPNSDNEATNTRKNMLVISMDDSVLRAQTEKNRIERKKQKYLIFIER